MKNKKLCGLMSLLLAASMLAGCGEQPAEPTTSGEPTTTQPAVNKFTVRFLVDGVAIKTIEVEEGQKATFDGVPTKAADAEAPKYRFKGWDKDIGQAITANTDFNAIFEGYSFGNVLEDFESYTTKGSMTDAGWKFEYYPSTSWVNDVNNEPRVGYAATSGEKSLANFIKRDAAAHRMVKEFDAINFENPLTNAFKFSIKAAASYKKVSAAFYVPVTGISDPVEFKYTIATDSNRLRSEEYVTYVIPFADENWNVWDNTGSVYDFVNYYAEGADADAISKLVTKVQFAFTSDDLSYKTTTVYIDDIAFTTVADGTEYAETEATLGDFDRYTASIMDGAVTVRIDMGENDTATATLSNDKEHPIHGNLTYSGKNVTFTSDDDGEALVYTGRLTNGNQKIKFVSAAGTYGPYMQNVDFNAVQVLDDFESYEDNGTAYHAGNTLADKSPDDGKHLRGSYYMEFLNGSSPSPWNTNNSTLMGNGGNQINLWSNTNKSGDVTAHSGEQYASMKISNGNVMRYMTWGMFDHTVEAKNSFRGKYLSFWVKSDVKVATVRVRFYYNAGIDGQSLSAMCNKSGSQAEANPGATIANWTHFVVELDPLRLYYGVNFQLHNNNTTAGNMFIDDMEVYTANPYMDSPTIIPQG